MNSKLYNKVYDVPSETLNLLKKYDSSEIVRNLISTGKSSYSNLKRIKHEIENGRKDELGGDKVLAWINQTLNSDRSSVDTMNKAKSDAGQSNVYNKPHSKSNLSDMNRISKSHSKQNADLKITETLKRINQIISKIN